MHKTSDVFIRNILDDIIPLFGIMNSQVEMLTIVIG
jgi:hypothetical protein